LVALRAHDLGHGDGDEQARAEIAEEMEHRHGLGAVLGASVQK
jgi:hypothetical protein